MTLVHLSDLHFGSSYFVTEWGDRVAQFVNSLAPEILVITGDLTTEGHVHEYDQAVAYLSRLTVGTKLVVPGNHDARNEGYIIFEETFGTRYPFYQNELVALLGIDSSQPDVDDGHVGRSNYPLIRTRLSDRSLIRILAMHHHLVPIPGTGRERHIPTDAGDVLKLCVELGIEIVLSGHKHLPWVWRLENTWLITGGTATSRRLKGRSYPSFNILTLKEKTISLTEVNVIDGSTRKTLAIPLGQ